MREMDRDESKVFDESALSRLIETLRSQGKSIALCHGVFDLLHPGHITHFMQASMLADSLFVSVTADEFVNKGPGRPLFNESLRASALSLLRVVDGVIVCRYPTAVEMINLVKPDFYVKGQDYLDERVDVTGKITDERVSVESHGGKIHFTSGFTSSSSKLINEHFSRLNRDTKLWIEEFKRERGYEKVHEYLEKIGQLRPLIVGETIVDQYTKCLPLSKSSKYPLLAFQITESKSVPGGVLAIANNCSSWTLKSSVVSFASIEDEKLDLVRSQINSEIDLELVASPDRPTILKHRYIDSATNTRLFEYYDFIDSELIESSKSEIIRLISTLSLNTDLVIAADYGHGFFDESIVNLLEESELFLAVNTQANAGNRGFNTISKHHRADLISLNGAELQLELRNRKPDYEKIVPEIINRMAASYGVLTLGAEGIMMFDSLGNFEKVPAFADVIVDKVGAGDAVFAMCSLLAKVGAPLKVMGFLSNLVAAHEVSQLGHQSTLAVSDLLKQTKSILG